MSTLSQVARDVPRIGQEILDFRKNFGRSEKEIVLWLWYKVSNNPKALDIILKQSALVDDLLLENGVSLGMHLIDAIERVKNCPSLEDSAGAYFSKANRFYVWVGEGDEEKSIPFPSREEALNYIASHLLINKGVDCD